MTPVLCPQALTPEQSALVNNLHLAAKRRFPLEHGLFDRETCATLLCNAHWEFDKAKSWLGQQASLLRAQKTRRWNEEHGENMPLAVPDQVRIAEDGPDPSREKYKRVLDDAVRKGSSCSAVSVFCTVLASPYFLVVPSSLNPLSGRAGRARCRGRRPKAQARR